MIATSRRLIADPDTERADRDLFEAHRTSYDPAGRHRPAARPHHRTDFYTVSRRRDVDGRFAGVVGVSLQPSYLDDFYRELSREHAGLTVLLYRADGAVIMRHPADCQPRRARCRRTRRGCAWWHRVGWAPCSRGRGGRPAPPRDGAAGRRLSRLRRHQPVFRCDRARLAREVARHARLRGRCDARARRRLVDGAARRAQRGRGDARMASRGGAPRRRSRRRCANRSAWRRSASSPAASRTTSTTC